MAKNRKSRPSSPPAVTPDSTLKGANPGWRRHIWRLLAIWGLVFVAYSNAFHGALVFDSASLIGQDPRIRRATPENINSILTGGYWYTHPSAGLYRPFTTFSHGEFEAALRSEPGFFEARVSLGKALTLTGRRQEAIAQYEAALRIRPGSGVRRTVERLRAGLH